MYFGPPLVVLPHLRSGRLRPIAVSGNARLATLPEVPTAMEAGVKAAATNFVTAISRFPIIAA